MVIAVSASDRRAVTQPTTVGPWNNLRPSFRDTASDRRAVAQPVTGVPWHSQRPTCRDTASDRRAVAQPATGVTQSATVVSWHSLLSSCRDTASDRCAVTQSATDVPWHNRGGGCQAEVNEAWILMRRLLRDWEQWKNILLTMLATSQQYKEM